MKHDHFCKRLSLIAPGDERDCIVCKGEITDAAALEKHKRAILDGGMAKHWLANRTRRLQGLVRFK